jgi:hypothetical protein
VSITPSEARAALKGMANRDWPNYESAKQMLEAFIEQVEGVSTVGGAKAEAAAETRLAIVISRADWEAAQENLARMEAALFYPTHADKTLDAGRAAQVVRKVLNAARPDAEQPLSDLQRLGQEFDAAPVTEQVQPVAVTTHGQLDLIRRDDSGKMFPLDGYLHRSVEAIPLFTSPPDQSVMHPISAAKAAHFEAKDALPAETAHRLGEMVGALETVLGLAYSKDGVKLGPDKGLEIKIVRARSLLAKLREVRG